MDISGKAKREHEGPEVLRIENLTKNYGVGNIEVKAVDGVSLSAKSGEIILIMGPSGSGKTTLITMAGALLKPNSGDIFIDNQNITQFKEEQRIWLRRKRIGFIFQSFNLLANLTALENVIVPLGLAGVKREIARKKAKGLLATFGLSQRETFLPEKLSGGEKQRVSIARALANDPKLILADEPTANLDSQKGREVMRILKGVAKNMGKTVVIVTHDQRLREIADRVLWMEDGRFKDSLELQTDPVCGAHVEEKATKASLNFRNKTYWFCSSGCKKEYIVANNIPTSYL